MVQNKMIKEESELTASKTSSVLEEDWVDHRRQRVRFLDNFLHERKGFALMIWDMFSNNPIITKDDYPSGKSR